MLSFILNNQEYYLTYEMEVFLKKAFSKETQFQDMLLKDSFKTADFVKRAMRESIEIGHHKNKESLGTERKGPNIATHFKDERHIYNK